MKKKKKNCCMCGKEFEGHGHRKTCGPKCHAENKRKYAHTVQTSPLGREYMREYMRNRRRDSAKRSREAEGRVKYLSRRSQRAVKRDRDYHREYQREYLKRPAVAAKHREASRQHRAKIVLRKLFTSIELLTSKGN